MDNAEAVEGIKGQLRDYEKAVDYKKRLQDLLNGLDPYNSPATIGANGCSTVRLTSEDKSDLKTLIAVWIQRAEKNAEVAWNDLQCCCGNNP